MAFASFGNAGGSAGSANMDKDLETIQTEDIGFLSIAGDAKLRLTTSWEPLPAPTSSLLSIASRKGLVAAAGPDQIVIATTESVRKGFEGEKDGDSDIRSFTPQLKLPMPMRVSQLAFTADENYLILSAESGGGLAVYEVQSLLSGSTNSAFELSTNGESLRLLAPNPTSEKAELCAIVTSNGNLHMANLKERKISDPLKGQVSCVSWSAKGKQLCAGLGDGTIHQMTPEGEAKAEISKPSGLGNHHVSSLLWLENNMWLAIYTTTGDGAPTSVYNVITRQTPSTFTFQKIADPVEPFVPEKTPHHSLLRIRDYHDLSDLLLVSSSASTEVGLLSRAKKPLATDKPADSITNVFTTTELLDDSRRPTLPMTDSMEDSVPIGTALDLSSKDKVYKPIPSDEELNESPTPLPGLWLLTHEGLLCAWWLVYTDAVKQAVTYSGLAVADASAPTSTTSTAPAPSSAFGSAGGSAFGSTTNNAAPAFGSSAQLGSKSSPWGASASGTNTAQTGGATFGQSSFGSSPAQTSPAAPAFGKPSAFGQSSQIGMRTSPWATGSSGAPAFGQSGFSSFANKSSSSPSPFGAGAQTSSQSTAAPSSSSGGFAGFASQGGFGSVANSGSPSVFGGDNKSTGSAFGSTAKEGGSAFGGESKPSASPFGSAAPKPGTSVFGGESKPSANPFGASGSKEGSIFGKPATPSSTPFGSAAQSGGVFGTTTTPAANPFASSTTPKTSTPFGSSATPQSKTTGLFASDAKPSTENNPFAPKSDKSAPFGSTPFKLESSFKPDPAAKHDEKPSSGSGGSMFGNAFGSALDATSTKSTETSSESKSDNVQGEQASTERTPQAKPQQSVFGSIKSPESTTPTTTPGPSIFGNKPTSTPGTSIFGQPTPGVVSGGSLFGPKTDSKPSGFSFLSGKKDASKSEEQEAPLPPDTTSKLVYPLGDSSSSSATSNAPNPTYGATSTPLPSDSIASATPKATKESIIKEEPPESPTGVDAPLPPDFTKTPKPAKPVATDKPSTQPEEAPLPPDFVKPNPNPFANLKPTIPESSDESDFDDDDEEEDEGEGEEEHEEDEEDEEGDDVDDDATEGSGVDVAKDLSPEATGMTVTPGFTPQSSFSGIPSTTPATAQPTQDRARPLFGEVSRNAPLFARPKDSSPRSPSPLRGAVPNRVLRSESTRSVSAPGMASQILGPKQSQSQLGASIVSREKLSQAEDSFITQHRKLKERQELEETKPLVDEEDDEIQKILASEVEGSLSLDDFVAHSNMAPPAQESVPSQVEAVYRDINSMIDTVGLNARSVKAFVKGHTENSKEGGRVKDDLEIADDWVLCEVDELGGILDNEVYPDLEDGRVNDLQGKLEACQELARDMHRLRAKQEDLKKIVAVRTDPGQSSISQSLPLSAEQASQQNELRREFANFSKLLSEAEEALTLLKTRIATATGSSGRGATNMPTVEAVMRTITKMTSMVEKRSGDIDVLENQLRKLNIGSTSREGSPAVTPQARKSVMFSPESTPARNFRHSFAGSIGSIGSPARATTPRKKVSGFSKEEKSELMEKRARRQAVLSKLKKDVEKKGVNVWNMEDIE